MKTLVEDEDVCFTFELIIVLMNTDMLFLPIVCKVVFRNWQSCDLCAAYEFTFLLLETWPPSWNIVGWLLCQGTFIYLFISGKKILKLDNQNGNNLLLLYWHS